MLMILMIGILSHWKNLIYQEKSKTWLEYIIPSKKSKSRYSLSLDNISYMEFSRCFSNKSKVKKILITYKNL